MASLAPASEKAGSSAHGLEARGESSRRGMQKCHPMGRRGMGLGGTWGHSKGLKGPNPAGGVRLLRCALLCFGGKHRVLATCSETF